MLQQGTDLLQVVKLHGLQHHRNAFMLPTASEVDSVIGYEWLALFEDSFASQQIYRTIDSSSWFNYFQLLNASFGTDLASHHKMLLNLRRGNVRYMVSTTWLIIPSPLQDASVLQNKCIVYSDLYSDNVTRLLVIALQRRVNSRPHFSILASLTLDRILLCHKAKETSTNHAFNTLHSKLLLICEIRRKSFFLERLILPISLYAPVYSEDELNANGDGM